MFDKRKDIRYNIYIKGKARLGVAKRKEMIMTEKATRKELFARIAEAMADDQEVVEMCNKYIEQLSKPRKKAVNKEAEEFAAALATHMAEVAAPMTISELAEQMGVAWQKVSAALKRLIGQDAVIKIEGEGKAKATYVIA